MRPVRLTVSTTELLSPGGSWTLSGGMLSVTTRVAGIVGRLIVSLPVPCMKLNTSTLMIRCPAPQASATETAAASASPIRVLFMEGLLVEGQRGRHDDPAFAGKVVAVGGEADVESQEPEPESAAQAELQQLALVARDAAPHREGAGARLGAHMHHRLAAAVHQVRAEGDVARRVHDVGDGGHRHLRLGMGLVCRDAAR